jgi:hypothetical protein
MSCLCEVDSSEKCPTSQGSGADRDRTDDLLYAIQALSQLSYGPMVLRLQQLNVGQTAENRHYANL